ncbi:MAG: hypothetical protein ACR2NN_00310 [Bryobacteraceae bacterium]
MTDAQLYLAVGVPCLTALAGIVTNVAFMLYLAAKIGKIEERLSTKLEVLTGKVVDVDNRVTRIEAKLEMA